MEYYGYHVFAEKYEDLTIDQALFLDIGLTKLHNDMNNADDKTKRGMSKVRRPRKRF